MRFFALGEPKMSLLALGGIVVAENNKKSAPVQQTVDGKAK